VMNLHCVRIFPCIHRGKTQDSYNTCTFRPVKTFIFNSRRKLKCR
jgi:hypothetical protein